MIFFIATGFVKMASFGKSHLCIDLRCVLFREMTIGITLRVLANCGGNPGLSQNGSVSSFRFLSGEIHTKRTSQMNKSDNPSAVKGPKTAIHELKRVHSMLPFVTPFSLCPVCLTGIVFASGSLCESKKGFCCCSHIACNIIKDTNREISSCPPEISLYESCLARAVVQTQS